MPNDNPTMWPSIGVQRWQDVWSRYSETELIVRPASFHQARSDWVHVINEGGHKVAGLFARDPNSFEKLEAVSLRPEVRIALAHDPALYLRESDWIRSHRTAASEAYDLASFRDDHETNLPHSELWSVLESILPGRLCLPLANTRRTECGGEKSRKRRAWPSGPR